MNSGRFENENENENGGGAVVLVLVLVLVLGAFAAPALAQEPPDEDVFSTAPPCTTSAAIEIVVLHTNDLHGQIYPLKAIWLQKDPVPDAGGFSALASAIRKERAAAAEKGQGLLLLDAGDTWSGTPEGDSNDGHTVAHWLSLVGYDAVALGNHEFDAHAEKVEPLVRASKFPWLCANLVEQMTGKRPAWMRAHVDRVVAGLKVTVVGVIGNETKLISSAEATRGFDFSEAMEEAREEAKAARARGAEVVIVLSHCGLEFDKTMAGALEGVDLIVGGHTHVGLETAWSHPRTKTLVAATYSKGSTVGKVVLTVEVKRSLMKSEAGVRRVTKREGRLIQVLTDEWPKDAATDALVEAEVAGVHKEMSVVIGEAETDVKREKGFASSPLGNWIADLMRETAGAEIGIHNKAGIRADIARGPIRLGDLYEISPYGNTLVSMTLSGRDLREELEHSFEDPRFALEASGIEVRYDLERPKGDRAIRIRVRGEPLDLERRYRVVANNFIAWGGDGHVALLRGAERKDLAVEVLKLHADDVRKRGKVRPQPEPRLAPAEATDPGAPGGG